MKLGIMQPYHFPYIGYFQNIALSDKWIVFDIVQYIRHGWVNRNRILRPDTGWQYINVPVKGQSRELLIQDADADMNQTWKERIINQLSHYKKKAPFYTDAIATVEECLFGIKDPAIVNINIHILKTLCRKFRVPFDYEVCSDMYFDFSDVKDPGDWALEISSQMGAAEYINPPGGKHLFDASAFERRGVKLSFLKPCIRGYKQFSDTFEPGLSIIDVMMFNSPETVTEMMYEGSTE